MFERNYMFYIPTYQEADQILLNNRDVFNKSVEIVDGVEFHIFDYRLGNYTDFAPKGANEMRGIVYRKTPEGMAPEIALHKFFNLGQGGEEEAKNFTKIEYIQIKEDGSMITPHVINGKIYCKTRKTFSSDQAQMANKIFNLNDKLKDWVIRTVENGMQPIFELVSPFNKIVLDYQKTELRLLQIRDMVNGEYAHVCDVDGEAESVGIISPEYSLWNSDKDIFSFYEEIKEKEGLEGYVVTFENGHKTKCKTNWYLRLHHILTEGLMRENDIIAWILNEELDDVLSQVPETDERKNYALDMSKYLRHFINEKMEEIKKEIDGYNGNRKDFAIAHKEHSLFSLLMAVIGQIERGDIFNKDKTFDLIKAYVLKRTAHWNDAKQFLNHIGFKHERLLLKPENNHV